MMSNRSDVLWSPAQEDKFILHGSSLSLYRVESLKPSTQSKGQVIRLSDDTQATLLSTNTELLGIRCVSWYPASETLVAAGLSTGKVIITNFGKGSDANSLNGKELIPKHARACNQVAWNPLDPNLIAESLDKYRSDYSILIYDVHQRADNLSLPLTKAVYELGQNEVISSLAWFYSNPKSLITGVEKRFLKIYDLRDTSRPRCVAYTKAVNGIAMDRSNDYRLATFQENQILLWDTRNFEKPTLTIPEHKNVVKLSWCPTRNNLLACLSKDSAMVKLYDITHSRQGNDESDCSVVERYLRPFSNMQAVSSFDWHHSHHNRMLAVSHNGHIKDSTLFEKIAVSWSPDVHISWACGRNVQLLNSAQVCHAAADDIALKMKRRAHKGYGIQTELWNNQTLTDDAHLRNLWRWLNYAKTLLQDDQSSPKVPFLFRGIKAILKGETVPTGSPVQPYTPSSDLDLLPWQLTDGHKLTSHKRIFRSEERAQALKLCCWGFEKDSCSSPYIDQLEKENEYERAAAIAVFTLRMSRAIQVLHNGSKSHSRTSDAMNLNMVAMALSGYYDNKNTLWKDMCHTLYVQLTDPYLRAMFAFLTSEDDKYEDVLKENDMGVVDKVAFACIYLQDTRLQEFISTLTKRLIEQGNLDGICLTGLGNEGLELLQQYVDRTGDVQTAAVTVIQVLHNPDVAKDPRVQSWIESYRSLLDVWGLWTERAEYDVYKNSIDTTSRSQHQVYACCNFCGKTIGYTSMAARNRPFHYGSGSAMKTKTAYFGAPMNNTAKVTSCPGCRKPLPRCSLCLVNMGTPSGSARQQNIKPNADKESTDILTPFSDWFTWCQSCRHGGHANHMTQWFSSGPDTECPVTGCSCRCTSLDHVAKQSQHLVMAGTMHNGDH